MSNLITSNFKYRVAKNFQDAISGGQNQLYVFYGRPLPWDTPGVPNTLNNNQIQLNKTWSSISALKKIYNSDISLAFERKTWLSGTVYDYYTDRADLATLDYYVLTSNEEVWKCIDNNNGSASTVEPTQNDPNEAQLNILETADGYRWKYLFTIPTYRLRKYNSASYIPISSNTDVVTAAVEGTIDKTEIISAGSGYDASSDIPIFIEGDGRSISTCEITITSVDPGDGSITGFSFSSDRGSNYIFDVDTLDVPVRIQQTFDDLGNISIGGGFESAYGIATINPSSGGVTNLVITMPGKNYQVASAKIVQSSAYAFASTNPSGEIESVTTKFAGSEFRQAEPILVTSTVPTAEAELHSIISPYFGHGGNPEQELNINSLIFSVYSLFDENGDFSVANDFRTVGIISNPISKSTGLPATENSLNAKYVATLIENNAESYVSDELLAGALSEVEATLIDSLDSKTIRYITRGNSANFSVGETIVGEDSNTTSTIESITEPEVIPYSGDILLINNGISFERNQGQLEVTTFIVTF